MISNHTARRTRSIPDDARASTARRRHRRLGDRQWLLIGAIVFGLEIVLAVGILQAVI